MASRGRQLPKIDIGAMQVTPGERIAILTGEAIRPAAETIIELPLDQLYLEHQPRELVPEEQLQRLIAEDRARPAELLEELRWAAAADGYYAEVYEALESLARSIASQGVLQPIEVVNRQGRTIIRDGHRRSLASHLAGRDVIPARYIQEPTELESIARPLIVNLQRQDLTALERAAAILRLALAVGRHLASEEGHDPGSVTIEALVGTAINFESPTGDSTADGREPESPTGDSMLAGGSARTVTGLSRALAAAVRERVCAMTGLSRPHYYRYLALNRLDPEARALGRGLTEGRLRPIVSVPVERQAELLAFAQRHQLSDQALTTLAQVMRRGDEDEVRRVMTRLSQERARRAGRTATSWESLLVAIPADYEARLAALCAELAALPPERRRVRLEQMRGQLPRLAAVQAAFSGLVEQHADGDRIEEAATGESER